MIVVRCLNGAVLWEVYVVGERPHHSIAVCLNDRFRVPVPLGPPAAKVAALDQLVTHSVGLRGAVQQLVQLDL